MCTCAHFCYKMVHCGIFVQCIVEFVRWVYSKLRCPWDALAGDGYISIKDHTIRCLYKIVNHNHIANSTTDVMGEYKSNFRTHERHLIFLPHGSALGYLWRVYIRKWTLLYQKYTALKYNHSKNGYCKSVWCLWYTRSSAAIIWIIFVLKKKKKKKKKKPGMLYKLRSVQNTGTCYPGQGWFVRNLGWGR